MSSDSELDEFLDALDDTPEIKTEKQPPRVESPVEHTEDIEEEEKRILKLQKKAEERRREEDNEIKRRWETVQKKKQDDMLQQIQEERWKEAELSRRHKLEQMRMRLMEDSTPSKRHSSTSSGEDDPTWEDKPEKYADRAELLQSASDEKTPCEDNPVKYETEKSSVVNTIIPEPEVENLILVKSHSENSASTKLDPFKETEAFGEELRDLDGPKTSVQVPSIQCRDYELEIQSSAESNLDNSVFLASNLTPEEPDIVKSAKPRQPQTPQTLIPPVAPPRRRKKRDDTSSEYSSEDRSSVISELLSPGLPLALPTPTSTVESLTRELENSLDIQSAIGGQRLIHAQDAEIGAINSDHSSPVSNPPQSPTLAEVMTPDPMVSEALASTQNEKTTPAANDSPSEESEHLGRPRSNSGRLLTDEEILEMVMVVNLDTGEKVPLNLAEDALPKCVNPLALHIMRRTKEFRSDSSLHKDETDEDETKSERERSSSNLETSAKRRATKFKNFLGKTVVRTVSKVKSVADQSKKVLQGDDVEEEVSCDGKRFKFKACSHNKGPYDFQQFRILQDLSGEHTGAVWTMKFSPCGRLLATGGQDNVLRIWIVKSAWSYFEDLRHRYSEVKVSPSPSPAPSEERLDHSHLSSDSTADTSTSQGAVGGQSDEDTSTHVPFVRKPFCSYRGHTADLLDVSWSKNYFILSSSMDKTVRLWHISRRECLCTFQHIDFVTAIVFHPRDDRYFLSGSLDGKLRLWNIPDKKVTMWNEVTGPSNLITTANFCQNGKFAVVGTYDGKCIFYSTDQLKYYTQIHVRSTRGKNARGRKITGIEPMLGEDRILVTSNDSRIRLYDLRDLTLTCKYKGCTNNSSQIKSSFSPKSKYIISGSEDHFIYVWKTQHECYKFSSARRDRNDFWEAIKVHNAVVTAAIFSPNPSLFNKPKDVSKETEESSQGEIIISADFSGTIKVIQNKLSTS